MSEERSPMDILAGIGVEPEVENEETPEEETVETPTEEVAPDPDPEDSAEVAEEEPELILGKFKDQEALTQSYQEIERRMTQEAQKRADYERQLMIMQQQMQQLQQPKDDFAFQPRNANELVEWAYESPDDAFWFAAEKAPQLLPKVISEIRQFDPEQAEVLSMQYNHAVMEMQREEVQTPVQQIQDRHNAQLMASDVHSVIASKPLYNELREDIALMLGERQNLINMENPASVKQLLSDLYDIAELKHQQKSKSVENASRRQRVAAAGSPDGVESGSTVETPTVEEESPAESMRNSILSQANGASW